jgi:hypothetical protein
MQGQLGMATAMAKDYAKEHGRPIPLNVALKFLPLVASQKLEAYDQWSCHWLKRWLGEAGGVGIEQAAELAGALADLPSEPKALGVIREMVGV